MERRESFEEEKLSEVEVMTQDSRINDRDKAAEF